MPMNGISARIGSRHLRFVAGLMSAGLLMLLLMPSSIGFAESSGEATTILNRIKQANQIDPNLIRSIKIESGDQINAYTNGQDIVLTTAIWRGLSTEDMRAFVIAHELAHVLLKHIQSTQLRRVGLSLFGRFMEQRVAPGSLLSRADDIGLLLVDRKFSRDVEYQADESGIRLMRQAGYNPKAAMAVFQFLKQANGGRTPPEFLSTHPISESRIRNLSRKYQL
jgi:predicted Zn-dependent protease